MSVMEDIQRVLSIFDMPVGMGEYPDVDGDCVKVKFDENSTVQQFMGGGILDADTFDVVVRGSDYISIENNASKIKAILREAGFLIVSGYENVEPKDGDKYLQISQKFRSISKSISKFGNEVYDYVEVQVPSTAVIAAGNTISIENVVDGCVVQGVIQLKALSDEFEARMRVMPTPDVYGSVLIQNVSGGSGSLNSSNILQLLIKRKAKISQQIIDIPNIPPLGWYKGHRVETSGKVISGHVQDANGKIVTNLSVRGVNNTAVIQENNGANVEYSDMTLVVNII